ncbi:chlorophyll a-b binding protein, chloroplastic [Raphidocelis subcapitata]|uniref:Chlorophyll a-b binding protein, chloroplastic n=1 Tax=Raphidocelis subcapitata TaxID=307507 RepID=A0A2V0NPU1_9CHLO|nr:chlorophyll a-b binding protein, chloroplastic [Raphidocelis subcapitata]|eukprot:GBF88582.1 chlorophyll a-b binding protein, chloroplastic [Raphidocelis subcapitata]
MKVQALFKKGGAAKPAPKKAAAKSAPKGGSGTRKGWLGGTETSNLSKWYGPDRALFLPGGLLDRDDLPLYLDGTLPGDYGYDPLGLGKDTEQVAKYRVNELIHARWAMLAAAGIIIPEGLAASGSAIKGATWFETPAAMLNGGTLNWSVAPFGVLSNPLPLAAVALVNTGLMAAVESFRGKGEGPAGYSPGVGKFDSGIFAGLDPLYPGGPFDPLGLADDPEVFQELQVKEIKNGRLAMISVLAFAIQGVVTKEGPYANISKHLADPFGYNLLSVLGAGEDRVPTL